MPIVTFEGRFSVVMKGNVLLFFIGVAIFKIAFCVRQAVSKIVQSLLVPDWQIVGKSRGKKFQLPPC